MELGISTQLVKGILERREMVVIVVQDHLEGLETEIRREVIPQVEMETKEKIHPTEETEEIKVTMLKLAEEAEEVEMEETEETEAVTNHKEEIEEIMEEERTTETAELPKLLLRSLQLKQEELFQESFPKEDDHQNQKTSISC